MKNVTQSRGTYIVDSRSTLRSVECSRPPRMRCWVDLFAATALLSWVRLLTPRCWISIRSTVAGVARCLAWIGNAEFGFVAFVSSAEYWSVTLASDESWVPLEIPIGCGRGAFFPIHFSTNTHKMGPCANNFCSADCSKILQKMIEKKGYPQTLSANFDCECPRFDYSCHIDLLKKKFDWKNGVKTISQTFTRDALASTLTFLILRFTKIKPEEYFSLSRIRFSSVFFREIYNDARRSLKI